MKKRTTNAKKPSKIKKVISKAGNGIKKAGGTVKRKVQNATNKAKTKTKQAVSKAKEKTQQYYMENIVQAYAQGFIEGVEYSKKVPNNAVARISATNGFRNGMSEQHKEERITERRRVNLRRSQIRR